MFDGEQKYLPLFLISNFQSSVCWISVVTLSLIRCFQCNFIYIESVTIEIVSGQKPRSLIHNQAKVLKEKNPLSTGRNLEQDQTHTVTVSLPSACLWTETTGSWWKETVLLFSSFPLRSLFLACPSAGTCNRECFWADWQAFTSTGTRIGCKWRLSNKEFDLLSSWD